MKDQYAGDENDYVKFGLLRALCGRRLSVFVAWMLTPDDGRTDGRRLAYLERREVWRAHDPPLFDTLQRLVARRARTVAALERRLPLPRAKFHPALVPTTRAERQRWWISLLESARGRDLVFFDPDNGLEVKSAPAGSRQFRKYLAWEEVTAAAAEGHSVLIYQHYRREARGRQAARLLSQLRERTGYAVAGFHTAHVLFLLATAPAHRAALEPGLARIEAKWAPRIAVHRP